MKTEEQKATLDITTRTFEVDMSQHLLPQGNRASLTMAEVKGCLTLPMKTKYHGWKKVPPKGDFNYEIKLTGSTDSNEELSADSFSDNPISCKIQGCQQRSSKGVFHVETCKSELDLFFDSSLLNDCPQSLSEDRTFKLPFQLIISDDSSSFTIDDHLIVTVKEFKPSLNFLFVNDDKNRLVFSSIGEKRQQVGVLRVSHNASFSCAPDIDNHSFQLKCLLKETLGSANEHKTERNDVLTMRLKNSNVTYASISGLKAGECVEIPVFIDMANINNPHSSDVPDRYELAVTYDNKVEHPGGFDLYRNEVLTKRRTFFAMPKKDGGTVKYDITMHNSFDLGELFLVQQVDTDYTLILEFMNEADAIDRQHSNAAVLVWDVNIESVSGDIDHVKTRNGKSLKDIFKLSADTNRWALNPKRGNSCCLYIKLKAGDIEGIIPHHNEMETFANLTLHLKYHAKEDAHGDYYRQVMNGKTSELRDIGLQSCELNIRLKKQPMSEWLCVDFGTSAVVAAFAKDTLNDRESLIDLKGLKRYMLDVAYGKDDAKNSIADEDDNLISSTVCFNNDLDTIDFRCIDGNPDSFKRYPVWFSPSVENIKWDYLLPCLKTIIGYKHLPNIFTDDNLRKFKYRCGEDVIGLVNDEGDQTALMEVGEVAKIIYRQLFKYYLSQRLGRNGQLVPRVVNKLVISVPNTYTPLNIQTVKDLARDSMPGIYPEYLFTVSESDAVACYYVSHQNEFLNSIQDATKRAQLTKKESVLVYDMGAGTLDLTWFVKQTKMDDKGRVLRVDVDIRGKLGVSKAGNYLDYELADILKELYQKRMAKKSGGHKKKNDDDDKFEQTMLLDLSDALGRMVGSQDRMELKSYVKELKKKLSNPEAVVPRLEIHGKVYIDGDQGGDNNGHRQQGVKLKMRDILENEHFGQIIDEMTQEVLENFGERYGENGKLDVDVLIFSGRSTSLKSIREGVKKHISRICQKPEELLYADLCAGHLNTDIQQAANMDNSQLKTVVTQGALAYATMFSREGSKYRLHGKKYYASFGLMKYYTDRSFEYVPLIDERRAKEVFEKDGIIKSSVHKVCTSNLTQVDLVQSYSSHEEKDYKAGNFDTISKLCEIPCQGLSDFDVQLIMNTGMEGVAGTTLSFKVGQGCNSLDPHDDFNNLSLRKSLWPVIYDNGENPNR